MPSPTRCTQQTAPCLPLSAVAIFLLAIGAMPAPASAQVEVGTANKAVSLDWIDGPERLLITAEEVRVARTLEADQRQAFYDWFWKRRDPRPETPRNEFRDDFNNRVAYVDRVFGDLAADRHGWTSARGLCYLILGPPDSRRESSVILPSEGGVHAAEIWEYADQAPRPGSSLQVTFALLSGRDAVVFGPTRRDSDDLHAALNLGMARTVTDPDWAFGTRRTLGLGGSLRLQANVWVGEAERDVELSLSLSDLYGQIVDETLVVELELRLIEAPAGTTKSRSAGVHDVMHLRLALDPKSVGEYADQPVRVLVRLPLDGEGSRYTGALEVVESSTGRRAVLPLRSIPGASGDHPMLPDRYPVGKLLAVSKGPPEGAVAMAFFSPSPSRANEAGVLWLSRNATGLDLSVMPPPVDGIALLHAKRRERR